MFGAEYISLYGSAAGTFVAIASGLAIIVGIQILVARIFAQSRTTIDALTYFSTSMVAILMGIYVCDLLIAGPDVLLLHDGERAEIVGFAKDICLMVFSYFFGTKAVQGNER
jgi:hypothetical protein